MERIDPASIIRTAVAAVEARMAYLEASKIRLSALPFCKGKGIDIGCRDDKITPDAIGFDKNMHPGHVDVIGDARYVSETFPADNFDYVFSSHCLEDILDTNAALREWLKILKPGGHLILYVPHPALYKGCNLDHRHPGFTPEDLVFRLAQMECDPVVTGVDSGPDRYSTFVVVRKRGFVPHGGA
jgi:SAM-dependent methyltransferase